MKLFILLIVLLSTVIDADSLAEIERMMGQGVGQLANPAIASKVASPGQLAGPSIVAQATSGSNPNGIVAGGGGGIIRQVANPGTLAQLASPATGILNPTTVAKTVTGVCTRTKCYEQITEAVRNNVENIVMTEASGQISYLNSFLSSKFSSYYGPIIAVSLESSNIYSKVKSNDILGAAGIVTKASAKSWLSMTSFSSCAAYAAPFIGPYSIIPGAICSIGSGLMVDNTIASIDNEFRSMSKKETN
jgi:hypothetical protein